MEPGDATQPDLSAVVVPLLKGAVEAQTDPKLWQGLLKLQGRVRDYVAVLGLELILDEAEGHAFLRSRPEEEGGETPIPRLIARRPLSCPVSLLLALLRKRLAESDAGGGEGRLVLTREQIVELLRVYLPETSNEAKQVDRIDAHIAKVVELGFLRRLKGAGEGERAAFEVRRILKPFVDAQWLGQFDARLAEYRQRAEGATRQGEDGDD